LLIARYHVTTDNAYVAGNVIQVTPQVAGTVVALHADDTDLVEAGQILVELDDADARIALQSAEAALAEAVRGVRGLFAGAGQSSAVVDQRAADIERVKQEAARSEAELRRARDDYARKEALFRNKFISADGLQIAKTALQSAEASRAAAQASVQEAGSALVQAREQKVGADVLVDNTSLESHPRVAAAAANVKAAYLALRRTRIVAPARGYVARRKVQLGERIASGAALMAVVPSEQMWVDANFKETELANVRIGQPVILTADALGGGVEFRGHILGLGAGTGGAFAVLPAQNASGNWIKIVQRLPVRIALDPKEITDHPLLVGLSMKATADTRDLDGPALATGSAGNHYETPVFDDADQGAAAQVRQIIAANRGPRK
jgi:membrane fusion protein (multidrug efflux system)